MADSVGYDSLMNYKEGTHEYYCRLLELYTPLIQETLKATHVLPEIGSFIPRKAMNEIRKVDRSSGNSAAVDVLLKELMNRKEPGWFRGFIQGLRNADFGALADSIEHQENMKNQEVFHNMLQFPVFPDILNKVDPNDIILVLFSKKTLTKRDCEEIRARMTEEGQTAGMEVLLDRIPRHREEWFTDFMIALRRTDIQDYINIVEYIEPKMAKVCEGDIGKVAEHLKCVHEDPAYYTGQGSSMVSGSMEQPSTDQQEMVMQYESYSPQDTPLMAPNPRMSETGDRYGPEGRESSPVPGHHDMELDIRGPDYPRSIATVRPLQSGSHTRIEESFVTAQPSLPRQLSNQETEVKRVRADRTNPTLGGNADIALSADNDSNAYITSHQNNLASSFQHVKPPMEEKILNIPVDLPGGSSGGSSTLGATSAAPGGQSTLAGSSLARVEPGIPVVANTRGQHSATAPDNSNTRGHHSATPPDNSTNGSPEIKQELKLRSYQQELAEPAMSGRNVVIIAPTGSGKTHVALGITKDHLEKQQAHDESGKVVFIVPTVELVQQQWRQYRTFLSQYTAYGMSGDVQDNQKVPLGELIPKNDIIILTPQIMVDALTKNTLDNVGLFTLMIFDECHHATKQHPYNVIMRSYLEEKLSGDRSFVLPQVIGLTASVGVGKARDTSQAIDHILSLCGNLDCDGISTVNREKSQLRQFVNTPDENKVETRGRAQDPYSTIINSIMDKIEHMMKTNPILREVPESQSLERYLTAPSTRGGDPYTQWISRLEKPVARIHEQRLRRPFHACIVQLKTYNSALRINADCRTKDAVEYLIKELREIEPPYKDNTDKWLERLFLDHKAELDRISLDPRYANPKLKELEKIILDHEKEKSDMRVIIFCKTRALTIALQNWMLETPSLKHLNADRVTGGAANAERGGMTLNQQEDVLKFFKDGKHKVIVATSVAEEGLDVSKCNLVVRYEYVTNEIAMIQARGRGRAEDSQYVALGERGRGLAEKEELNKVRESMMNKAIVKVQELPDWQRKHRILQYQQQAKVEWDMQEAGRRIKDRERMRHHHGDWELRCLKCDELGCFHSDIRVVEQSHHFVLDDTFHERILVEKHPDPKSYSDFKKTDKIFCKKCKHDWGIMAIYKSAKFAVIKISAFVVINTTYNQRDVYKKWKDAPFHVSPLSPAELQEYATNIMERDQD